MGDKYSPRKAEKNSCEQKDQKILVQFEGPVRTPPPKPLRKNKPKETPASITDHLLSPIAMPPLTEASCENTPINNCTENVSTGTVSAKIVTGIPRDDVSEPGESEEIIPPVHQIISALEKGFIKGPTRNPSEIKKVDCVARGRLNFDIDGNNGMSTGNVKSPCVKKVPPQVPQKLYKGEPRKVLAVNKMRESQSHSFELGPEECGQTSQEDNKISSTPSSIPYRIFLRSDSNGSDSSAVDTPVSAADFQQQDIFNFCEQETKTKSIVSFTTEDVEFSQKRECTQSPILSHCAAELIENLKCDETVKRVAPCPKERNRCRRSKSVGPSRRHLEDVSRQKEPPKVPAKPKPQVKEGNIHHEQLSLFTSDQCVLEAGKELTLVINQSGTYQVKRDEKFDSNTSSSVPLERLDKSDAKCRSNNAIDENVGAQKTAENHVNDEVDGEMIMTGAKIVDEKHLKEVPTENSTFHRAENCTYLHGNNSTNIQVDNSTNICVDNSANVRVYNSAYRHADDDVICSGRGVMVVKQNPLFHLSPTNGISTETAMCKTSVSSSQITLSSTSEMLPGSIESVASCPVITTRMSPDSMKSMPTSTSQMTLDSTTEVISLESSESMTSSSQQDSCSETFISFKTSNESCNQDSLHKHSGQNSSLTKRGFNEEESATSSVASFPEFDITFEPFAEWPGVCTTSSLTTEIFESLSKGPNIFETNAPLSTDSTEKTAVVSRNESTTSSDIRSRAKILSIALDATQKEMADCCTWDGSGSGKKLNFVIPDNCENVGSSVILRSVQGNGSKNKTKTTNRQASRAESIKQWQRITRIKPRTSKRCESDSCDVDLETRRSLSDFENFTDSEGEGEEVTKIQNVERPKQIEKRTAYHLAQELLTTEKSYVRKLNLVDQNFQLEIVVKNRTENMFGGEVIPQMFSNIKSIYQFHHDFLLPQLEKRMAEWSTNPRIGDVMKKFAPFLKLYTEYVKNFDNAINTINYWMERSAKFQKLIEGIQKQPQCGHLNLQHHMLEPIQRVPRYELLLKEYLSILPKYSPDRSDTSDALELVTQAARHSNEVMRTTEKFRKLIDIKESLGGTILDLISTTREFVKEGKLTRISARDGAHMDRYIFLFNDLLLVCQSQPLNIGQKQQYRLKSRMDFDGMEVIMEGHNLETANTFYVKGKQKSVELHTGSPEEKTEWIRAFTQVFAEFQKQHKKDVIPHDQLGKRAPTWIKDQETSMCMCCSTAFSPFRRRHHCRACGNVVCGKCSSKTAPLPYIENREKRVCDGCFRTLNSNMDSRKYSSDSAETVPTFTFKAPGILRVKASDPAVIQGYMNMCCNRKTWNRRFFAVHKDFVMYCFKAHQDVVAMTSLPLPGYKVECDKADETIFRIFHPGEKKHYFFQTEDTESKNRWVDALQQLVMLQLPTNLDEPKSPS